MDINHVVGVDVFAAYSTDGGATWGPSELVLSFGFLLTNTAYAALGDTVTVAWETNGDAQYGVTGTGTDIDLVYKNATAPAPVTAAKDWALFQ